MPIARPPTVSLQNVSKRFEQGPTIIEDLVLEVASGEFISFVGPSGCGKSTLLRLIAGLTQPTTGSIRVGNKDLESEPPEMAFLFQEPTLLPWLTVRRNIELPQKLRGLPLAERTETAERLAEWVGLKNELNFHPRQLSGGMQMRVSLARALSLQPSILLLDEPFGALDAMTRNRLNEELLLLRQRQNWTAFFVTHSVNEAVFLSSRVLLLSTHPARIQAEIAVPFPYPRTAELRQSLEFQKLVASATAQVNALIPNR